ncbi:Uncharacterised protein [Mycobacteroides abscessus subsp. abscessus]|nr:Uncharacterised protein [Mycobacteroides abscessus subsp. abscessus]SHX41807.1 Uncharacterised protein [Mycobacteroides abscessus subsp. abscessus]
MPQMVGTELQFKPVGREALRRIHDTRVVDEEIDPWIVGTQLPGGRPDIRKRRQVQPL